MADKTDKQDGAKWQDRLIEVKPMRVGDVLEHALNPKVHPEAQLDPLRGLLDEVGKADVLRAYYSERNGGKLTFWDGHARQALDINEVWHVAIYDFTDAEADLLLATFDPIGWAAEQSRVKVEELLRGVSTGNAAVMNFLSKQAEEVGIVPPDYQPVEIDESSRLDQKTPVECPACGHRFTPK